MRSLRTGSIPTIPLSLDKVWSTPTREDSLNAIPSTKEWIQNHRDEEPGFEVIEMEDGSYFAQGQYTILQSMKEAGRTTVLCHVQEYLHERDTEVNWKDIIWEDWLDTYYTPIPLDKVRSVPITGDDLNEIPDHKEWVQKHKGQEPMLDVVEMEDGTYFASGQYAILQAMKEAGMTTAFCHIQKQK